MISRRAAIGSAIAAPVILAAGRKAKAATESQELDQVSRLIAAFFSAANASNWAFVRDSLEDYAHGKTNDHFWSAWSFESKDEDVITLRKDGPFGYLPDAESIYSFLRSRQYQKGWKWSLPRGENSVWSPDYGVYCCYSEWERTDGGSYAHGAIRHNPTYLHVFGVKTNEQFGAVVSRKINWMQEVSLRDIVYG